MKVSMLTLVRKSAIRGLDQINPPQPSGAAALTAAMVGTSTAFTFGTITPHIGPLQPRVLYFHPPPLP